MCEKLNGLKTCFEIPVFILMLNYALLCEAAKEEV